jgi:glutathione S-transferase
MPELKLSYFDFHGSRGETARLALTVGKVPFVDHRIAVSDFPAMKASLPFGALPILEVDGHVVAQSNGINRYVGKLAGLYPEDALQAAICDEIMDAVEDIVAKIAPTMFMKDEAEKKKARQDLVDGALTYYLTRIARQLETRGGEWFADGRLTVADLKVFVWVRSLLTGKLDHVPTDLPARVAPGLVAHYQRVKSHPVINSYYESRGVTMP